MKRLFVLPFCTLLPVIGFVAAPPAEAVVAPEIVASLDRASYEPGAALRLTVTENLSAKFTIDVVDSSGTEWTVASQDPTTTIYEAHAGKVGGTVTVTLNRTWDRVAAKATTNYAVQPVARWPGHRPGHFYLGMSCGTVCSDRERELDKGFGVLRQFKDWGDLGGIAASVQSAQAANRLPWLSIKPPLGGVAGWRAVADGTYDRDIVALAATLKANDDKPILLTFHHEPSNDGSEADGPLWAAAYAHFHDVLKAEGALGNVADPPILGDWLFNPANKGQDPENWVTDAVLSRAPFLGIDLYENNSGETFSVRIPRVLDYVAAHGYPDMMVGIGETGGTDALYSKKSAVEWINESLSWVAENTDKVGVVSYFNSTANSRDGVYWPLDESSLKLQAYRAWLDNPATAH